MYTLDRGSPRVESLYTVEERESMSSPYRPSQRQRTANDCNYSATTDCGLCRDSGPGTCVAICHLQGYTLCGRRQVPGSARPLCQEHASTYMDMVPGIHVALRDDDLYHIIDSRHAPPRHLLVHQLDAMGMECTYTDTTVTLRQDGTEYLERGPDTVARAPPERLSSLVFTVLPDLHEGYYDWLPLLTPFPDVIEALRTIAMSVCIIDVCARLGQARQCWALPKAIAYYHQTDPLEAARVFLMAAGLSPGDPESDGVFAGVQRFIRGPRVTHEAMVPRMGEVDEGPALDTFLAYLFAHIPRRELESEETMQLFLELSLLVCHHVPLPRSIAAAFVQAPQATPDRVRHMLDLAARLEGDMAVFNLVAWHRAVIHAAGTYSGNRYAAGPGLARYADRLLSPANQARLWAAHTGVLGPLVRAGGHVYAHTVLAMTVGRGATPAKVIRLLHGMDPGEHCPDALPRAMLVAVLLLLVRQRHDRDMLGHMAVLCVKRGELGPVAAALSREGEAAPALLGRLFSLRVLSHEAVVRAIMHVVERSGETILAQLHSAGGQRGGLPSFGWADGLAYTIFEKGDASVNIREAVTYLLRLETGTAWLDRSACLHSAGTHRQYETLQLLLDHDDHPPRASDFRMALSNNSLRWLKLLYKTAQRKGVFSPDGDGASELRAVVVDWLVLNPNDVTPNVTRVIQWAIDTFGEHITDDERADILHGAMLSGDLDTIRFLASRGVRYDPREHHRYSTLVVAVYDEAAQAAQTDIITHHVRTRPLADLINEYVERLDD